MIDSGLKNHKENNQQNNKMFKRHEVNILSNPVCTKSVDLLVAEDFQYYDKDGFELNIAEQKFYAAQEYPLNTCLNHRCWQEQWFELERTDIGLVVDHSLILHRCSYSGAAEAQLEQLRYQHPQASYLLNTKAKWGFDFALDAVNDNGDIFEVLHIEYDSNQYDTFKTRLIMIEYTIRHTDWVDAAKQINLHKDQWQHLKGFKQNDWKANFLLGWDKCEYTEKAI